MGLQTVSLCTERYFRYFQKFLKTFCFTMAVTEALWDLWSEVVEAAWGIIKYPSLHINCQGQSEAHVDN